MDIIPLVALPFIVVVCLHMAKLKELHHSASQSGVLDIGEYSWVLADVMRRSSSYTTPRSIIGVEKENHINIVPSDKGELVCQAQPTDNRPPFTFVYETVGSRLGVRLPFSKFQCDVLKALNVAPSQLHPNSWAIIRAFTILCEGLDVEPSVGRFMN